MAPQLCSGVTVLLWMLQPDLSTCVGTESLGVCGMCPTAALSGQTSLHMCGSGSYANIVYLFQNWCKNWKKLNHRVQRWKIKETAPDVDTDMNQENALPTNKCAKPATEKIMMQKCAIQEELHICCTWQLSSYIKAEIDDEELFIGSIQAEKHDHPVSQVNTVDTKKGKWQETLAVDKKVLKVRLNVGADCNGISLSELRELRLDRKVSKSHSKLVAYGSPIIQAKGKIMLTC